MAGSKWDEVLETLTESYKDRFSGIGRQDFVSFCADNKHIRNAAWKYLQNFKKISAKSDSLSLAKFNEGCKLYKDKYERLSLYNSSLAYATKDHPNLSDMYNNRSLVLDQLGHTLECLQDIEMALEKGYVEDSEIILRKAKCLTKLGDVSNPKDYLSKKDYSTFREKIQNNLKESQDKLPKLKGGENENFPCASSCINVIHNPAKGRHVVATHDINLGDVLFIEQPFAFVLFKDVCHNCCKNTVAPLFCWECMDVAYCSPKCRDNYQKTFHLFECGFGDFFKSIGIAHLSLRIILKAASSLKELKNIVNGCSERKCGAEMSFKSTNYEAVYNLVNNADKYEVVDVFQYSVTALLIALYLKNNTCYMSGASTEEDLKFLARVILRHILQLICNGHAIVDTFLNAHQRNSIYTETEERIGTAIYPSASMMNHSCQPSIINCFYNYILVVRAAKDIQKGEEVYNCYGPDARRMRRSERQEILKKQYFFSCQCHACSQKYDFQEIFTAFKCAECKGAVVPEGENSRNWICVDCGKISEISNDVAEKEILFYSLIKKWEDRMDENITLRLRSFLEIWQLGREIFYKFHKDLACAADEVARCLAILEDFRRCILFLRCCVLSAEKRFGSFSIEFAKEMKKLGDAITRSSLDGQQNIPRETAQEGLLYYKKAEGIISLLYGPDHREVEEIKTNRRILERKS